VKIRTALFVFAKQKAGKAAKNLKTEPWVSVTAKTYILGFRYYYFFHDIQ
jgi:hypothetical protein